MTRTRDEATPTWAEVLTEITDGRVAVDAGGDFYRHGRRATSSVFTLHVRELLAGGFVEVSDQVLDNGTHAIKAVTS